VTGVTVQIVGFNPFGEHKSNPVDIAIVVIAFVLILGLVAWAIFSG
jgi:pyrrolidone-carboxylate peptidase